MPTSNKDPANPRVMPAWGRVSGKIGLMTVFTALSLGTNYAMIGIPNIKIMDSLVFIAAFLFGLRMGVGVGVLTWAVYGSINPYGVASPILLVFLMIGETFYAIGGFLLRRVAGASWADSLVQGQDTVLSLVVFPIVGFLTTFAYDVLTNFASYLFLSPSLFDALVIGMVTGAPFALIHEASNVVFFLSVVPLALLASRRLEGGWPK